MTIGFKEFGCFISSEKSLLNFLNSTCSTIDPIYFPWCGLYLHTKELEVMADYSKLAQGSNLILLLKF